MIRTMPGDAAYRAVIITRDQDGWEIRSVVGPFGAIGAAKAAITLAERDGWRGKPVIRARIEVALDWDPTA